MTAFSLSGIEPMRFCTVVKLISGILEAGVRVVSEFAALDWRKQLQLIHNAPDVFNRKKIWRIWRLVFRCYCFKQFTVVFDVCTTALRIAIVCEHVN